MVALCQIQFAVEDEVQTTGGIFQENIVFQKVSLAAYCRLCPDLLQALYQYAGQIYRRHFTTCQRQICNVTELEGARAGP